MSEELKPCPFCGDAVAFTPYKNNGLKIRCIECGIEYRQRALRYGLEWLEGKMAETWNRRATQAAPASQEGDERTRDWISELRRAHVYLDQGKPFFSGKDCAELADLIEGLASSNAAAVAVGEPITEEPKMEGTFGCPICGKDSPHQHSGEEVARHRWAMASAADLSQAVRCAVQSLRGWADRWESERKDGVAMYRHYADVLERAHIALPTPIASAEEAITQAAALSFIDQFEIVGDNNDSRDPTDEEKFVLREFVLQLFDDVPEQTEPRQHLNNAAVLAEFERYFIDDAGHQEHSLAGDVDGYFSSNTAEHWETWVTAYEWTRARAAPGQPRAPENAALKEIAQHLTVMMMSASCYVNPDDGDAVTGYRIKTGAIHRVIGFLAGLGYPVSIPSNMPLADDPAAVQTNMAQWKAQYLPNDFTLGDNTRNIASVVTQPVHEVVREPVAFQARVQPWLMECFGPMIAGDREERNHRFFEEAAELVQACGMTASEAHQLVDYTWGRPMGEPFQEVGGVMVTLAALCLANGLDMHAAGETELARINVPETIAKIRAKQAAKPKHSPLPEA
ncbi:hypothetical protein P3T40_003455 [Paraburkholderia sp. EB58]|uniref:Lar family restriction alleviation protein n=1 Tax=Paraburkholderia sp. EB58 TaxID=3035125 RepID=UPI003D1A5E8E